MNRLLLEVCQKSIQTDPSQFNIDSTTDVSTSFKTVQDAISRYLENKEQMNTMKYETAKQKSEEMKASFEQLVITYKNKVDELDAIIQQKEKDALEHESQHKAEQEKLAKDYEERIESIQAGNEQTVNHLHEDYKCQLTTQKNQYEEQIRLNNIQSSLEMGKRDQMITDLKAQNDQLLQMLHEKDEEIKKLNETINTMKDMYQKNVGDIQEKYVQQLQELNAKK